MIDWYMTEIQAVFAGCRDYKKIKEDRVRNLILDLNAGLAMYMQSKSKASEETWQLYRSAKITGLQHALINGLRRVDNRLAKEILLQKKYELVARLEDEYDQCVDLVGDDGASKMLSEEEVINKLIEKYEKTNRYHTSWKRMNEMLVNFSAGDVMLLCGLSNTGKTSFALQLSYFAGHKTLYFGVDMTVPAIAERLLKTMWYKKHSNQGYTPLVRARCDQEVETIVRQRKAILPKGIRVYDADAMTLEQIEYNASLELKEFDAEVLIIDYTGRIDCDTNAKEAWREEQKIARSIKGMAKRLNIRVIALAQFNSHAEKFKKPENSWISGSKELISASDIVITLWQNRGADGNIDYSKLNVSDQIKNRDSGVHDDFSLCQFGTYLYEDDCAF